VTTASGGPPKRVPNIVRVVTGSALATGLAIVAGLAGSVQVAVMSRLGERIGVLEALAFASLFTAVLSGVVLVLARRSAGGYKIGRAHV